MFYSKNTINSLNILIINLCNKDKLNIRYIHITLDVLCEKTYLHFFIIFIQYINISINYYLLKVKFQSFNCSIVKNVRLYIKSNHIIINLKHSMMNCTENENK